MHPFQIFGLLRSLSRQWLPFSAIEKFQRKRIQNLIGHAYRNVPFYRDLFDSNGIRPEMIKSIEDLQSIPPVSKKQLMDMPLDRKMACNVDPDRCLSFITSGTTGIPLHVFYRKSDWTEIHFNLIRAFLAAGMRPFDKMGAFVGKKNPQRKNSWYTHLGLGRGIDISSWNTPELWIEQLRAWNPQVLIGYVMNLRLLAEAVSEKNVADITPRLLFSGSGVLDENTRQLLSSVFHCRIIDLYASFEAGYMAWECEKCGGYHICSDSVVVEILKNGEPAPPGEEGEVVITNLHSYAMPLIRYRQADLAVPSDRRSRCGRGLPLLEKIQGRLDDCIVLKDKRRVASQPFYYSIEPVPGIKRWRLIQEALDHLLVIIEPLDSFKQDSKESITRNLRQVVGPDVKIEFQLVEKIKISPQVKFRQIVSKIDKDPDLS